MIHAARVLSEDSPAAPAVRLAVEQGRVTVSDASRVMDEPAEDPAQGPGTGDRGWVQEPRRRGAGGCPGGGLRRWARLSAVLGRPHGGSGERRHGGSHQPARTWGEVRRWWCQVRTPALVTLGVGWGLLRAGYRLRPAQSRCGAKSVAQGVDGAPESALETSFPSRPESPGEPVIPPSSMLNYGPGGNIRPENGSPGLFWSRAGSFSREGVAFRAGLAQVQLARLRLAEPDNVFGDRPEEPVFWAWAILTPIYQRLRRARRLLSLRTGQDERMDRIPCSGIQEPQGLTD